MKPNYLTKVTCLLALALPAQAQIQNHELDPLIVSAGLAPINLSQIGGSVTVITAADIAATQATYLSDVLRQVSGFAINQSGGPGTQTQLRVRGAEANHVLVLMDGIRVNDPTASDEFLFNYALVDNIERIEVIRGPQSAIWGTDAMSAVINIISKDSTKNHFGFDLEVGSFNTKRMTVNGGYVKDLWQLDAGINGMDTSGSNVSRNGNEKDGYNNLTSHIKLSVDPTDEIDFNFSLTHSDAMNEFDGTDFVLTGLPIDADLWTERTQSTAQFSLAYQPNQQWLNEIHYQWSDVEAKNFMHNVGETSSTAADTNEIKLKTSVYMGQADQHRLSAVFDHREIDFIQRGEASTFGDPNQNQNYDVTGIAAEYHHQLNDEFSWNLSARNDDFNRFDDVSNFKVAATYKLTSDWRIRGSIGTGSKAPSFIERFGFFPASFIGNPNLKPEESDAFELAVEKSWSHSKLEVVYFDQDLSDEINGFVFDVDSGLFTAANQVGDSQRHGLELNWAGNINQNWGFNFNYTYTDATEQNFAGDEVEEVRRPQNMAHLSVDYHFANNRAQLYAQINYQDDQLDVFFDPSTFVSENLKLDGFTTFDLTFSWQLTKQYQLYAKGQNLFDESYEEVLGYARPGAAFSVGFKARF